MSDLMRSALESRMWAHMLIQWPLLMLIGAVLAQRCHRSMASQRFARWNERGLPGLLFGLLTLGFWMTPVALDHAVSSAVWDAMKVTTLLAAGAALRFSWRKAGAIVQAFFIGNAVWMSVAVGMLYQELPQRLCNAYLQADQMTTGIALVVLAALLGAAWALAVALELHRASQMPSSPFLQPHRRTP